MSKVKGSAHMVGARMIWIVLQIISIPIYFKTLGRPGVPAEAVYGVLTYIVTTRSWMGVIDLDTPVGAIQRLSGLFGKDDERFWRLHRTSLALSAMVGFVGLGLLTLYGATFGFPHGSLPIGSPTELYFLAGLQFLFDNFRIALNAPYFARERFTHVAMLQSIVPTTCVLINVALVLIFRSAIALAIGWVLESFASLILTAAFIRRQEPEFPFVPKLNMEDARAIYNTGIRSFAGSFASRIGSTFDKLIVGNTLGPIVLSYYQLGCRVPQILMELLTRINEALVPHMTRMVEKGEEEFSKVLRHNSLIVLTLSASGVLVICGFGPAIVPAWTHKPFVEAGTVCALMGVYYALETYYGTFTRGFLAKNKSYVVAPFAWFNAAITAFGTGPIGHRFGIVGVAGMNVAIDLLQIIPLAFLISRHVAPSIRPLQLISQTLAVVAVASLIAAGGYFLTHDGPLRRHPYLGSFASLFASFLCLAILVTTGLGRIPEQVKRRIGMGTRAVEAS